MFHLLPHGHHPVLLLIVVGVCLLGSMGTIADLKEADKRITQAILDTLAAIHMTHKVACDLMVITKGQWSRVLSCDLHVSLTRLRRLGFAFNAAFMPRYLQIVADDYAQQVAQSAKERGGSCAA